MKAVLRRWARRWLPTRVKQFLRRRRSLRFLARAARLSLSFVDDNPLCRQTNGSTELFACHLALPVFGSRSTVQRLRLRDSYPVPA